MSIVTFFLFAMLDTYLDCVESWNIEKGYFLLRIKGVTSKILKGVDIIRMIRSLLDLIFVFLSSKLSENVHLL